MKVEYIKEILNTKDLATIDISSTLGNKLSKNILNNFCKLYNEFNPKEILFLLRNKDNLENLHIFCKCGNKSKFLNFSKGYQTYCSASCAYKYSNSREKAYNTMIKKYGKYYVNSQKAQATKLNKYGDKNFNNVQKRKITNLNRYGTDSFTKTDLYKNKTKETCLKKYGKEHFNSSDIVKLNKKESLLSKYGVDHYSKTKEFKDKYKNTLNKKYGCNNISQFEEVKIKKKYSFLKHYGVDHYSKTDEYKKKLKQTNLIRYGKEFYTQTQEYKDLISKNHDDIRKKVYLTKKKNHTFNGSKVEDKLYLELKSKFIDSIHHYSTDPRYPFECDFYIPSKDLFIELNFHWTHGLEPFDKTNKKHLEILNKWKSKNTKYFNNAIDVWTKRDPLKLEIIKKNNLNYKIFYNQNEFERWLNEEYN